MGSYDPSKLVKNEKRNREYRNIAVLIDGPDPENDKGEAEQRKMGSSVGWCVGDIDFGMQGELFIRNPYLANAIERLMTENAKNKRRFRMVRDAGFSGPPVDLVCEG